MKALEKLRVQLIKDYPGDTPTFDRAPLPKESKFLFENLVVPAFEKIIKEFAPFHFTVSVRRFIRVMRLEIKDGCSSFSLSIKTSSKNSSVLLTITYRDHSICLSKDDEKILLEERFDLSKIREALPEDLLMTIFSDTFINRKTYLKRIVESEENDAREQAEFLREERRFKLIRLKQENDALDPRGKFRKYLDAPQFSEMLRWVEMFYDLEISEESGFPSSSITDKIIKS